VVGHNEQRSNMGGSLEKESTGPKGCTLCIEDLETICHWLITCPYTCKFWVELDILIGLRGGCKVNPL